MTQRPPVEMVRVEREEEYFDREDVLGRDAASVFPSAAAAAAAAPADAVKALLGDRKFISETELQQIAAATGGRGSVEAGSLAADKPLAQVLAEQREAKEAAFAAKWMTIKQGKNRPLDDDEVEFLDSVAEAEAARRRRQRDEEDAELAAYQDALRRQQEAREAEERERAPMDVPGPPPPAPAAAPASAAAPKHKRPALAAKPAAAAKKARQAGGGAPTSGGTDADADAGSGAESGGGLGALLGGYGSGSD